MRFDPSILVQYWPLFAEGAWLTLRISVTAFLIGYALGIAIALLALAPGFLPKAAVTAYVGTLRSIPFIIILFVIYYGLPFYGVRLPALLVGTAALALFASAYYAEIVRAAILALPRGQFESARAIGMSPFEVFAAITVIYWAITMLFAAAAGQIERRTGRAQSRNVAQNRLAASFLLLERQRPA